MLNDFFSVDEKLPNIGDGVEVFRDFGQVVGNPYHPFVGCRYGIELTKYTERGFTCDMSTTGRVTHWRHTG